MTRPNEGGKTPSSSHEDETEKILQEMEDDGFDVNKGKESRDDKADDTEEDDDTSDKKDKEDDEKDEDEEDKDDDDEEDEDDADVDEDEEDDDEKDEDDEDEDDDDTRGKKEEKVIPLWRHKKELKQQKSRLTKELGALATRSTDEGVEFDEDSDEVKEFVKEFGLDEKVGPKWIVRLLGMAVNALGPKLKEVEKLKEHVLDATEEKMFMRDLNKAMPLIRKVLKDPNEKQLERATKKIRELAYSDDYKSYKLEDIIRLNKKSIAGSDAGKEKRKTGEHGRRTKTGRSVEAFDLDNPDSIPWKDLNDAEFDKVSAALEKRTPTHKIIRRR